MEPHYTYKRNAFTIVELIFVIVIIAILAITALPKLAATRDDAKVSTIAHNTMVAASEIAAYATAMGETKTDLSEMSNAVRTLVDHGDASLTSGQPEMTIKWKGNDCLTLKIENQGANTEELVIDASSGSTGTDCDRLRDLIDLSRYPIPLHGNLISF